MAKSQEQETIRVRVGELSELLILSVLDRLNCASLPRIFESLVVATSNGRAPFFVGPSIEQVLEWRQRRNEVAHCERRRVTLYSITPEGKKTVRKFAPLIREYFPNLMRVRAVAPPARGLAIR